MERLVRGLQGSDIIHNPRARHSELQDYFTSRGGNICVEDLADITAPTLVVHGMKDVMVAEEHVHHLSENIRNSEKVRHALNLY